MADQIAALAGQDPWVLWNLFLALVAPNGIAWMVRPHWQGWVRALVMVATSVVIATVTLVLSGALVWSNLFVSIIMVLVGTVVAYKFLWKGDLTDRLEEAETPLAMLINFVKGLFKRE